MTKKANLFLLTAGIVLLGFFREYLFANINWIYLTLTNGRMNAARPEFQFLINWSPSEILILKWSLTILFSILFFGITYLIIQLAFKKKLYNRIIIYFYCVLIGFSALFFLIGKLTGTYETIYGIIRTLMGIVQSFLPLMLFAILFKFLPASQSQ